MKYLVLLTLLMLGAGSLHAEFNNMYPRTRFYSDLGRGDPGVRADAAAQPRRRNTAVGENRDFTKDEAYNFDVARFGGSVQYASDYYWRDFLITASDGVYGGELYGSFMGFEGSIFVVSDGSDSLGGGNPIDIDYRVSYTRKYLNSVNTVAWTHQDWTNVAALIGTPAQGFGTNAPTFEETADELSMSSYWFNETIQTYQSNFYTGIDAWVWTQGVGLRAAGTVGVMANKPGLEYIPNGARLQGSLYFQSKYHVEGSGFSGADVFGEMYWDFREANFPGLLVGGMEYYFAMDKKAVDRLLFHIRFELAF